MLINKIQEILSDGNARTCGFNTAIESKGVQDWERLRSFYKSGRNSIMEQTLSKALAKHKQLSQLQAR